MCSRRDVITVECLALEKGVSPCLMQNRSVSSRHADIPQYMKCAECFFVVEIRIR